MNFLSILIPLVEVVIIWVMINYLLKLFWGTRAMDVVLGFLAFLFVFFLVSWFAFRKGDR